MQYSPHAWNKLREHAAHQLPAHFADDVLRAARGPVVKDRSLLLQVISSPVGVSFTTAAACLVGVIAYHSYQNSHLTEERLAQWQEISTQVASLDPLP